jgi:type I restriction enzyme R subunit
LPYVRITKIIWAGWSDDQISEQKTFIDGKVVVVGDKVQRKNPERAERLKGSYKFIEK